MKFIVFGLLFFFMACTPKPSTEPQKTVKETERGERKAARLLEQSYATYRSQLISNVGYEFQFNLTKDDHYSGVSKIQFELTRPDDLTIDFGDGEIQAISVNGRNLDKIDYNKFFISIPEAAFVAGPNTVEIAFTHTYSETGSGLYRFVDPEDKKVYLYSDFEPYDANLMVPCFDQPDLKATYSSTVIVPKNWVVVSSTLESNVDKAGATDRWTFPTSKVFSTYVFSLHAGEYKVWNKEIKTKAHKIPLRLMARQTMAKYVDPEEWFTSTRQGFEFFESYFGYPYPYLKYDQVIVPDFNSGAMENVGSVTFNENRFLSRGQKQRVEKRRLVEVIMHEMAHMWFGDLVTMKWWNDIWLNESFATYAAYLATLKNTPYKEIPTDFMKDSKRSAYHEDQLVTTHPITFDVANTDVVFANFDGITYGKGASVLKQLAYYIGEENFKKGLQSYFQKYQFSNTELKDFMGELAESSQKDLSAWQKAWLETPQLNTVKVEYDCEKGKVANAALKQSAPKEYPTLRPHKTQIGVFSTAGSGLKLLKKIDLEYSEPVTAIAAMDGLACKSVALVYPNYNDHDYAKVQLDTTSLNTLTHTISGVNDELLRMGLWMTVYEMVIDQQLVATRYLDLILNHSLNEKSLDILDLNLGRALAIVGNIFPRDEKWKETRATYERKLSQFFLQGMKSASSVDIQKFWFDHYVASAEQKDDLQIVAGFLIQKPSFLKFEIDQDRRWKVIAQLSAHAYENYEEVIAAERQKDGSASGEKWELASRSAVPKMEVKKEYWEKLAQGPTKEMTLGRLRPVVHSIFPSAQEELQKNFSADFFRTLKNLRSAPPEYLEEFAILAPSFCTTESVKGLRGFTESNLDLPPNVIKGLKVAAQQTERCVGMRQKVIEADAKPDKKVL